MNWWNQYDGMDGDPRISRDGFECSCCKDFFEYDPCVIDHRQFCDRCANDIMQLRIDNCIDKVSDKTNMLVHEHNKKMYYKAYDKINFPKP